MNFIITCQRNLEDKTIEETRKLLDEFGDSDAKISKTQFSGIIQLDTSLDIFDVIKKFRVIIDEEPWSIRFCSRIIPIQDVCQSDLKSIKENIEDNSYLVRQHLNWCWRPDIYGRGPQVVLRYLRNIVLRDGVLD